MEIDTAPHLGTTTREVRHETRDGQDLRMVVVRRRYATTVDDLWDAVTTADRIPRWFLPVSGDLEVGGRYQLEGNAGGEVRTCEPPVRFGVTWEYGGNISWLDVELRAVGDDEALLELTHAMPADGDETWDRYGPAAVGLGWDQGLLGLGLHLASGVAVDPQEAMAWLGSPDGKDFTGTCSDAWGAAAVAAGEDEGVARLAAARTRAAYTGEPEPEG
jgi:uncharacterized protein YndB with AHSA1/START domain